ncbi:MAG TPA: DUF4157 domain-containing protein [Acidocella sp.]|jgi:hypothetical protein|nr:DUF4157 domain-containing protein [Acidocella sp.]
MQQMMQATQNRAATQSKLPQQNAFARRAADSIYDGGNQARLQQIQRKLQEKFEISPVNDPLEHEADQTADKVMRMPDAALSFTPAPPQLSRKCEACDEEKQRLQLKPLPGPSPAATTGPLLQAGLAAPGKPLDHAARSFIEPRLGHSLETVRIHDGAEAAAAASTVGARAFTLGHDIVFNRGEYAPGSTEGRHLLTHELTHVLQQSGNGTKIRRKCGHDGTPVNCHNWGLGLFPWLAGTYAHMQISAETAILWHSIPRSAKLFMDKPTDPSIAWGFADLWRNGGTVDIGEIKSTATGSEEAAKQAKHYVKRHDESTLRGPVAPDDKAYLDDVGGSKPGKTLDLSGLTGGGKTLGPFVGDPGKQLWIEADNEGAVVYWCEGAGLPSPLWLVAFKQAMDELKKKLDELRKRVGELVDAVVAAGSVLARWISGVIGSIVNWGAEHSRALAFAALLLILLVALIALILSILAEPPSAGTSTAPAIVSLMVMVGAVTGMVALIGVSTPGLPTATVAVLNAMRPAAADAAITPTDYDPKEDQQPPSAGDVAGLRRVDPGSQMTAALAAFTDPQGLASSAVNAFMNGQADQGAAMAAAKNAIAALRANGGQADADAAEAQMKRTGLA